MLLHDLVQTSRAVAATTKRTTKLQQLSALLARADQQDIGIAVAYLSGELRRKTNIGYASLRGARPDTSAASPNLTILEVDRAFDQIASVPAGPGSTKERLRLLRALLVRATAEEQDFLARLILGELRQGALAGLMLDAVAHATKIERSEIHRAQMLSGNLSGVAEAALVGGRAALSGFGIQLFRPLQPMLALTAQNLAEALERLGTAGIEYKLDGARIQVHKKEREVRIYSRRLNEVTDAIPEIVDVVRRFPARELVLDGEAIALQENGRPHDFQMTMKRFGSRRDAALLQHQLPLEAFFFDCLFFDGATLIDQSGTERFTALTRAVPSSMIVPRIETSEIGEAEAFMSSSIAAGHEGVVAKALDAPYAAGRRGTGWMKVKPTVTLDLVVLGAEWGHGRRHGYLSNLHLAARDPANSTFIMLGKTFKGMTDDMLAWQTRELLARETSRSGITVYVRPELVVEVAFDDIQASPRYPGGYALRFARVKRYRPDKSVDDADTIETVRRMFDARRSMPGHRDDR